MAFSGEVRALAVPEARRRDWAALPILSASNGGMLARWPEIW